MLVLSRYYQTFIHQSSKILVPFATVMELYSERSMTCDVQNCTFYCFQLPVRL